MKFNKDSDVKQATQNDSRITKWENLFAKQALMNFHNS